MFGSHRLKSVLRFTHETEEVGQEGSTFLLERWKRVFTWDFCRLLTLAVLILCPASVLAERLCGGDGKTQSMPVSDVGDLVVSGVQGLSVLVPCHLCPRRRVDDADDFSLVTFSRVNEGLFLLNLGSIWKREKFVEIGVQFARKNIIRLVTSLFYRFQFVILALNARHFPEFSLLLLAQKAREVFSTD